MAQEQRPTPQEIEAEIRARLRSEWISPTERRRLQRVLVLGRSVKRYRAERVRCLTNEQLINAWAAAPSDLADKLVDMSNVPDRQLVRAVSFQDIGLAADKDALADSAIAELAKRANNARTTVVDYIRRRVT
jgi:hypothetical protein